MLNLNSCNLLSHTWDALGLPSRCLPVCQAWCLKQGRHISLGTIGTERLWLNHQRAARNKARSRASEDSATVLLLKRWMREATVRCIGSMQRAGKLPPEASRYLLAFLRSIFFLGFGKSKPSATFQV